MTRLFTVLATLLLLGFVSTYGVGLYCMTLEVSPYKNEVYLWHFTLGLFAALGALLVHCIIFTYFLGTGRWVKEVGIAYRLPDEHLPKTTRELKRASFPPALFSMLITIATAAAGAGRQLEVWHWGIHFTLATLTILINLWAFRVEHRCLSENARVIEAVQAEVERIRAEHGLAPSEEDFIRQES